MASGKVRLIMRPPEERRFRRWMIICREGWLLLVKPPAQPTLVRTNTCHQPKPQFSAHFRVLGVRAGEGVADDLR